MFEGNQKILIKFLLLATGLMFQRGALCDGIVLLGVARRNLLTVDATLENFNGGRVFRRKFGERHKFFGQVRHKSRLN